MTGGREPKTWWWGMGLGSLTTDGPGRTSLRRLGFGGGELTVRGALRADLEELGVREVYARDLFEFVPELGHLAIPAAKRVAASPGLDVTRWSDEYDVSVKKKSTMLRPPIGSPTMKSFHQPQSR